MEVVGVSFTSSVLNQAFIDENELPYPVWSDGKRELGLHYGAADFVSDFLAKRVTVVLDAAGNWVLTYTASGDLSVHPSVVLADCAKLF
jgi:peroxiredoxin